jgi:hypothetical protein
VRNSQLGQRSDRALCSSRPPTAGTLRRCPLETSEISGEFNVLSRKYLDFPANPGFHDRFSPKLQRKMTDRKARPAFTPSSEEASRPVIFLA